MSGRGVKRGPRAAYAVIRLASLLVPAAIRADWLREWRGEVWARGSQGTPVLLAALGAFPHGLWLRREQVAAALSHAVRDVRQAMRALWRRPLFACSAVATLALGLGATTAVYSVVDAVLLAPLPYPGGERFVAIHASHAEFDTDLTGLSDELFTAWRERAQGFEAMAAHVVRDAHLVGAGTPEIVREARITSGYLSELLAVRPVAGRLFDEVEATGEGPPVVVISEGLWRQRFGGRTDVMGTVIRVDGQPREVIGVIPTVDLLPDVSLWTPRRFRVDHSRIVLGALRAIGRTAPGVTPAEALDRLEAAHAAAARDYPVSVGPFSPVVRDYRSVLVSDVHMHLLLLLGAVAVVLLIACVNVTNLFLARGVERAHELAVRRSLGATRGHLISQVLAEGFVIAVVGGAAGLALAVLSIDGILRLVPAEIPLATSVGLDGRVLAFAALSTMGTAVLVGMVPTLRTLRHPGGASGGVSAGRRASATHLQRRAGSLLLGAEVAQAAALLVAAGLMLNTLARMTWAPSGFEPEGLVFVHLELPGRAYATDENPTGRAAFLEDLRARLGGIPGVRSVGLGSATPFSGMTFMIGMEPEGGVRAGSGDGGLRVPADTQRIYFSRLQVDPGYLEALALPLVAGRTLRAADLDAAGTVALINETAARAYWPDENPLGKRIRVPEASLASLRSAGGTATDGWLTVVGVLGDLRHPGLPTARMAELYVPLSRAVLPALSRPTALIRHEGPADPLLERIRREVWTLDPELPIPAVATATHELGASLAVPRFYALLLGIFASLALALAGVGIYGVMAGSVSRRIHEMGIRMALGAPARAVAVMVMREGMQVVGIALVIGLAAGIAISRLLEGLLYGVQPADPWTASAVAALIAMVAAAAVWVPARRAMRADPIASLRSD